MAEVVSTLRRFSEVTIQTNDLDPVYEVIYELNKDKSRGWMGRFVLYFLLFYDLKGAFRCAEMAGDNEFWGYVKNAAENKTTKRGTERRHFRGRNSQNAITALERHGLDPWELLGQMYAPTYTQLYKNMTTSFAGTQFGPYFIWKLYDIFNVCLSMPISMNATEAWKYMPDEPKTVAGILANKWACTPYEAFIRVDEIVSKVRHPLQQDRMCSYAETETILCMVKGAFLTKSHKIGDDIDEKAAQLGADHFLIQYLPGPITGRYVAGELIV